MLNWIKNHSGALCIWSLIISATLAIGCVFFANGNGSGHVMQTAMYVGGIGLLIILLLRLPYPYVIGKLPADLKAKPWVDMSQDEFSRCGNFGIAALLMSTLGAVVVSLVLGFILSVATISIFIKGTV